MFHQMLVSWFNFVRDWGYVGVFVLMAIESSVVPIPSEVVMAPAAFWAAQGKMDFWLVVLAGTVGSYAGSLVSYVVSRAVGAPVVARYGKYFLVPEKKLLLAEAWITRYGVAGIFFSRLLPVVRHLISIPAGILKMNIVRFSAATTLGAGLWCTILSWWGVKVIGDRPDLLDSPETLVAVCRDKLQWFVGAVIVLAAAYALVMYVKRKQATPVNAL
ncbi:MAG: DedA family protein [Deltaproteobacteria bacterium]|nr:DedA family protein [Deltaproteobacteria bacterium]